LSIQTWLLLFLSADCATCRSLLNENNQRQVDPTLPILLALTQGARFRELIQFARNRPSVVISHLADPADVFHMAGVDRVPFAYLLRGETILAGSEVTSFAQIADLTRQAAEFEASLA
jgi:hypothetical protein